MPKKYDYEQYLGKTINKLKIDSYEKDGYYTYFNCICECGNIKRALASNIIYGKTTSCGCTQREKASLAHKKYNKYDLSGKYGVGWASNTDKEFYFDLEDYNKIKEYCWSENDVGYLIADDLIPFSKKHIRMHRLIMNKFEDDGLVVDHINHNKFDNRKYNLRVCSEINNSQNKIKLKNNKTGYTGVSINKLNGKYETYINYNYKHKFLGYYEDIEDAVKARKEAEEEYFGEYSYDNSIKMEETKYGSKS